MRTITVTKGNMPDLNYYLHIDFSIGSEFHPLLPEKCYNREKHLVIIVGVGCGASLALPAFYNKVLSVLMKASTPTEVNVVYIGAASYDRSEPSERQTEGFKRLGCKIYKLNVSEDESVPEYSKLRQILVDWVNVITCSGRNTLYALIQWQELGVNFLLKEAAERGVVLCGGSAGCVCWFSDIHTDCMRPDGVKNPPKSMTPEEVANWHYERITGLGFFHALCVPHYDVAQSNGKPRAEDSNRLVLDTPELPCIGIDEKAALVVVGDHVSCISGDGGKSKCYKKYVTDREKEQLTELPIQPDTELFLDDLLSVPRREHLLAP
jgi:peptidase E